MKKEKKFESALREKAGVETPHTVNKDFAEKFRRSRRKEPSSKEIIVGLQEGNQVLLSRAITIIESSASRHQQAAREILEKALLIPSSSLRIGITGVPGVGKSTFIESLGKYLVSQGKKVAVLAVDPSSSISYGSILGDKTRMEQLVKEKNAYIRPSASGDTLGGVGRKTRETITLCEAAGFDVILIETVGVGQSETLVHSMTDFFLLLKLAGAGDELQGIKRGIMEMADAIVINKADGENVKAAKLARNEFSRALHLFPKKESQWSPKVLTASGIHHQGIQQVWDVIAEYFDLVKKNGYFEYKRKEQNKYWLKQTIEEHLKRSFYENPDIKEALQVQLKAVDENKTTPFEAARILLELFERR